MNQPPQQVTHSISTNSIIKIICIILFFGLLIYIRDILLVLLTSVVIASGIEPAARFFSRRGLPRILAVIIVYLILLILIIALSYLILPTFINDLLSFMNSLPTYIASLTLSTHSGSIDNVSGWQSALLGLTNNVSLQSAVQNISSSLNTASGSILALLTSVFGGLTSLVIIIVLSFYLSVQEHGIEQFLSLVTPLSKETYVISLWKRTQHKIGRWIQGQLLLGVIVGILVFIALSIMRVEHAFILALFSGVFEIIPVFGAFIGSIPGVLTAFQQAGLGFGVIVAIVYLVIQQIESNIIYPIVVQKVLDVEPLVVMIALIVGAKLGGFLGILLAVPVAVALTEYMGDLGKDRRLAREKTSIL